MGLRNKAQKVLRLFFGPSLNRLLDVSNVCRCLSCCGNDEEGFVLCKNLTDNGVSFCNWCAGAQAGEYPHCHGMGNKLLAGGFSLVRPKQ